jgi:predicted TIM-barrel fold metal-dependent hydrolase
MILDDRDRALPRRRDVLQLAAVGCFQSATGTAAQRSRLSKRKGKIDVHHHFPVGTMAGGGGIPVWSPEIAIAEMDRNAIATGIGSVGPIPVTADGESARRIAREYNEYGARMRADYPERFGLLAALPLPDVEGALKEIEYASVVLQADGFSVSTSYRDMWLGDPYFRPVFEELNRRNAVVYVHPYDAPCCTAASLTYQVNGVNGPWIEWPMNTARTILSVLLAGYTRKLPKVRLIFSHGGGVMPLLVSRIQGLRDAWAVGPDKLRQKFPDGIVAEFRTLYFECAQAFHSPNFEAIRSLVPETHLLFGTDYNRFPISATVSNFDGLKLPARLKHAIERTNAESLFPRLKVLAER